METEERCLMLQAREAVERFLIERELSRKGPEPNAQYLKIEDGVQMKADALSDGNAGTIINYASLDAILWGKTLPKL